MNNVTDKEWYEIHKNSMNRKGSVFNIKNSHPFGVVVDGKMKCIRKHSFERFDSKAFVYAFLNDKLLKTVAELHDYKDLDTCYSFNTLYQAKKYIENFKKEYNLKESQGISFRINLSVSRKTYVPWRLNQDSSIDTTSDNDLHYDFEEAIKENPENKIFKHWQEERLSMNFASRDFDYEVVYDSKKDGFELTDEKIEEIRNSIAKRFNAYTKELYEENQNKLSCNSVLKGILDFEWDNNNDKIKHWNSLNLYCKDGSTKRKIFYEIHNDSFSIQLSNNIENFFMSSFGFINYDINVQNNKIIAKSNISKDIIKVDNVTELMTELNNKLAEALLKNSNEKNNDFFDLYCLPMKSLKTLKTKYNVKKGFWDIENISLISEDQKIFEEHIFKQLADLLNSYSEKNWDKALIEKIKINNTLPYREKMALYDYIKDFLIDNDYVNNEQNQCSNLNIKTMNFIFEVE
ncbi:MAG: hypothetical protein CL760_01215 [Chloroflexi bacterium]|nr:hypothetical protein [Chloroflexota bacterium]|tara:strand:- start:17934 stop:19316 length:1383 start_codon:yes stop_codon:yes gene_type:complete